MADIVAKEVRSRMMAGIRGKNTRPEIIIRRGLHAAGFRYKLHDGALVGRPDMVFPRWRAVLFAHGCFWHGHDCHLFHWPKSREEFWREKISRNKFVDQRASVALAAAGWRQAVVWECALKGKARLPIAEIVETCSVWLRSDLLRLEIRGLA